MESVLFGSINFLKVGRGLEKKFPHSIIPSHTATTTENVYTHYLVRNKTRDRSFDDPLKSRIDIKV